jgi:hypothetical protein
MRKAMMSGNEKGERSAKALTQCLQGMERPCGGMVDSTRHALDVGIVGRRESLLEILGVFPQVVPKAATTAEAGGVEESRKTVGTLGHALCVGAEEVGETKIKRGLSS